MFNYATINLYEYFGERFKLKVICADEKEEDIEIGAFELARDEILDDLVYQWSLLPYKFNN